MCSSSARQRLKICELNCLEEIRFTSSIHHLLQFTWNHTSHEECSLSQLYTYNCITYSPTPHTPSVSSIFQGSSLPFPPQFYSLSCLPSTCVAYCFWDGLASWRGRPCWKLPKALRTSVFRLPLIRRVYLRTKIASIPQRLPTSTFSYHFGFLYVLSFFFFLVCGKISLRLLEDLRW